LSSLVLDFNGSAHCYRTMLDLATRFVLFRRGEPIAPGWVRSRLASATRYLRWYRTSSPMVDNASLVLGILLIIMAAASAFQLRHLMDIHANRSTTSESIEPVSSRQPTSVLT
uniref:Energy-coupling factor transporter transmembrane protein EcfT n=1 Tax=Echinostoma caproni TaxID=27848 RepID=A0A183B985_9TREM